MKIYKHIGRGHWIGSEIAVVARDQKSAETQIRKILDDGGLDNEKLKITELEIIEGQIICINHGDY